MIHQHQVLHNEAIQGTPFSINLEGKGKHPKYFYIESYGCAMNFSDSEIVASILNGEGYGATKDPKQANLILLNTCSIREKAETTIRKRLLEFKKLKENSKGLLIGILGCMAERLKHNLLEEEKLVDLVVGPDAYRSLPRLLTETDNGHRAVNVLLSRDETYAEIEPIRLDTNGITAFISITRGCNNMCSFCVVPFTRGRERSRDAYSIVGEAKKLFEQGYREITLLGQNVDSYYWEDQQKGEKVNFARLLELTALVSPLLRIRFSTSHPKDITDDVLYAMAKYDNICKYIHLPLQSGSSRVLQMMNRSYSREWYLAKVDRIKEIIPDCGLSADIIAGFCTETEEDHAETLSAMEYVKYDYSYMFYYSERPGTLAQRRFVDDIPEVTKKRRLNEIIALQNKLSKQSYMADIGKTYEVLVEGSSKRSALELKGRNSMNKVVVFPKGNLEINPGDYVDVTIHSATQGTLIGNIVESGILTT